MADPTDRTDPTSPAAVGEALLAHLQGPAGPPGARDARFRTPPQRIFGGNQSWVYGLELDAAEPLAGPLVLRILRPFLPADSVTREAIVQQVLGDCGYPVARIHHHCTDPDVLGGPFQLMERLPGAPLVFADANSEGTIGLRETLAGFRGFVFGAWPEQLADLHVRLHRLPLERLVRGFESAGLARAELSFDATLARLAARAEADDFVRATGLPAVFEWLREQRVFDSHLPGGANASMPSPGRADAIRSVGSAPSNAEGAVLCHGDLFPNQLMAAAGRISGVIDWSDVCIARPELDVAIVRTGIATLPVPLGPVGRRIVRSRADCFFEAYTHHAPLDPELLAYAELFRCAHSLLGVAERRRSLRNSDAALVNPNPYDDPRTVTELCDRVQRGSGRAVEFCSVDSARTR